MAKITVSPLPEDDTYEVTLSEESGQTRHVVTLSAQDRANLGGADAEDLLCAAFAFLLEREPKEAILARFDIKVISRYFPEFESVLHRYLKQG